MGHRGLGTSAVERRLNYDQFFFYFCIDFERLARFDDNVQKMEICT